MPDAPLSAEPAAIAFDDGVECLRAGEGATLAFDAQRVHYTCSLDGTDRGDVIVGDIAAADVDGTFVRVTHGTTVREGDGWSLQDAAAQEYMIAFVTLADGTQCANAGQGATFGTPKLGCANYTCGDHTARPIEALLGPLAQPQGGLWSPTFAQIDLGSEGPTALTSKVARISRLLLQPAKWLRAPRLPVSRFEPQKLFAHPVRATTRKRPLIQTQRPPLHAKTRASAARSLGATFLRLRHFSL